ncbi:three-Cys-motif partner protein TcmP, partial [Candidatus Latescibacterota bacterium]
MGSFFDESREQSKVKSTIVSKYFVAWANVIIGTQKRNQKDKRIAYIDLFAGPGHYNDGTVSTPILILKKTIESEDFSQRLVTIFNDKNKRYTDSLKQAIFNLPGIERLKNKPEILTQEVNDKIVRQLEKRKIIPTLFFIDPWGYKGLSLRLVNSVLKDWGCDCIFFFNYNRINMGLSNAKVQEHMVALFGKQRAELLRQKIEGKPPDDRERIIIEELCQALKETWPQFVLPFRFKDDHGIRTTHHLIFVSKNFLGYHIMKEIMAK